MIPSKPTITQSAAAIMSMVSFLPLDLPVFAANSEIPYYDISVNLKPESNELEAEVRMELPRKNQSRTVEFQLADGLTVETSSIPLTRVKGSKESEHKYSSTYQFILPANQQGLRLKYRGQFDHPLETPEQEYQRSFSETRGVISPKGVYLSSQSLWYPLTDHKLVKFKLKAMGPSTWHIISSGSGTTRTEGGLNSAASWSSNDPIDDIFLVGGPLTRYSVRHDDITVNVFLQQPDESLAKRYIDATPRILDNYSTLIGPYPYQNFSLVENFWETGYGMPGFTLLGSQVVRFPFLLTSSYPHEILHNWWGNSVFVDYKRGNWCEGLTAYLADHLYQEAQGKGAEYRRDTLKRYRDYVKDGTDLPLSSFKGRNSPATEAVGYGKTLFLFHMLRRQIGDDTFKKAIKRVYLEYRWKSISFDELEKVFSDESQTDLKPYFDLWVDTTGAPDLSISDVQTAKIDGKYSVKGTLHQKGRNQNYDLKVPIAVSTAESITTVPVNLKGDKTSFEITVESSPLFVEADPGFDVFRLLDQKEGGSSFSQLFGATTLLAVLPSSAPQEELDGYRALAKEWGIQQTGITVISDNELPEDVNLPVWIFGSSNKAIEKLVKTDAQFQIKDRLVIINGHALAWDNHASTIVRPNKHNALLPVGWIVGDVASSKVIARKLPHYGKYGYVIFDSANGSAKDKGEWIALDVPTRVDLRSGDTASVPLPVPISSAPLFNP